MKTEEELIAVATAIKNEILKGKNSSERIGQLLLDLIDYIGAGSQADAKIGDLSNLTTTTKTNLVAAIDELVSAKADKADVGTLSQLQTTAKNTLVAAINELYNRPSVSTAGDVSYSKTTSGLKSTTVQGAVDELAENKADKSDVVFESEETKQGAIKDLLSWVYGYQKALDGSIAGEGTDQTWFTTEFVEIKEESVVKAKNLGGLTGSIMTIGFFDEDKICLVSDSYKTSVGEEITLNAPSGAKYVRFSGNYSYLNGSYAKVTFTTIKRTPLTDSMEEIKEEVVDLAERVSDAEEQAKNETHPIKVNIDKWNYGYTVIGTGNVSNAVSSSPYVNSDKIDIPVGCSKITGLIFSAANIAALAYYGENGEYLRSSSIEGASTAVEINSEVPSNAVKFSISGQKAYKSKNTINLILKTKTSSQLLDFETKDALSKGWNAGRYFVKKDTLTNGQSMDVSMINAKNKSIGFSANITTFTKIKVGTDYAHYDGTILEIDGTNVVVRRKYGDAGTGVATDHIIGTYTHGLTFSNFVSVNILNKYDKALVIITTATGEYKIEDLQFTGCWGTIHAESVNSSLTNCELCYMPIDINKDTWIFGDSYLSYWAKYCWQNGYTKAYFDGFPGCSSSDAYLSFEKAISIKMPKRIVWALGMNDADGTETINESWIDKVKKVAEYCDKNGVELILVTIPNVPQRSNIKKNDYIYNSSRRYVDIASCVQVKDANTWFDGLIGEDNLHPSDMGSKVIAAKYAASVPEIAE